MKKIFKSTNHHELRNRVSLKLNKVQKTDQSYKNACDINVIIANATKTGVLPFQTNKVAQYIDNTEIPSLLDAQNLLITAKNSFMALPSQIRKLMDHDPTKLVDFINDPENKDILLKHGILEKVEQVLPVDPTSQKGASESEKENKEV